MTILRAAARPAAPLPAAVSMTVSLTVWRSLNSPPTETVWDSVEKLAKTELINKRIFIFTSCDSHVDLDIFYSLTLPAQQQP